VAGLLAGGVVVPLPHATRSVGARSSDGLFYSEFSSIRSYTGSYHVSLPAAFAPFL